MDLCLLLERLLAEDAEPSGLLIYCVERSVHPAGKVRQHGRSQRVRGNAD